MPSRISFWISTITALLASLAGGDASAQVIEIDSTGHAFFRSGAGAVTWSGDDASHEARESPPDLPQAALTVVNVASVPDAYREALVRASNHAAISPDLLATLVWQESRWNARARSPAGAIGLGQLMPDTARQLGVDPRDPAQNLLGAAIYLRWQLDRFDNNIELALAAYNSGPDRVERAGAIPNITETRNYVAVITRQLSASVRSD